MCTSELDVEAELDVDLELDKEDDAEAGCVTTG